MSFLNRLRSAIVELVKPAGTVAAVPTRPVELAFAWHKWCDPLQPEKYIHECDLPGGAYFLAQEVSAPDPNNGHWGWQLMTSDNDVVEMRNGFFTEEQTKEHAEKHFRTNYVGDSPDAEVSH